MSDKVEKEVMEMVEQFKTLMAKHKLTGIILVDLYDSSLQYPVGSLSTAIGMIERLKVSLLTQHIAEAQ